MLINRCYFFFRQRALKFKNAKYLFYCFNNFLSESNVTIKKIKQSTVTDDFISAEEIQNQIGNITFNKL